MGTNIKFLSLSLTLASAALTAGCSDTFDAPGLTKANCVIEASVEEVAIPASRTVYDPTEYTTGQIGINWLPSDRIGVYSESQANQPFTNTSETETDATSFTGSLDGAPVYAYYPYSESAGGDYKALKGNIPATQKYNSATRQLESDWKVGTPSTRSGSSYKFKFEHIFPLLRFEVNASGTTVKGEKLEEITLTIPGVQLYGDFSYNFTDGKTSFTQSANASTMTMVWSDQPELSDDTFYGFMTCVPLSGIQGKEITVAIKTSRHTTEFKVNSQADELKANSYYTLDLNLRNHAGKIKWEEREDVKREDAAWKPGLESKLACANWVFSMPNTPFMHKIRVADATQTVEAYNLPEGLTWNAKRRLVQGQVNSEGNYTYSVEVRNADGSVAFSEGIKLTVSNRLAQPTPHMGWQSWNVLETNVDESSVKAVADAMVANGFVEAGYIWLGIDDCWQAKDGSRDSNGAPNINTSKWPNGMKAITDYIHSKGMKAGIYSDAGEITCASGSQAGGTMLGAYGYETATANAFVNWGFDKLKEDWFWKGHGDVNGSLDEYSNSLALELYSRMGDALVAAGNPQFLLSMCEWGLHEPWKWGPEAGASSWRMSYDARDGWMGTNNTGTTNNNSGSGIGIKNTIDLMRNLWPYVGVNRFCDCDMLCVGIRGSGSSSNDLVPTQYKKKSGDTEYQTNFAMWCMYGSPLLITCDLRKYSSLNSHDMALLKNAELIAINQDPMGQGAEYIKTVSNVDYYMKDLANGDVAIAAVNLSDKSANYTVTLSDYDALDTARTYKIRELISKKDDGTLSASSPKSGSLAAHATVVFRLSSAN